MVRVEIEEELCYFFVKWKKVMAKSSVVRKKLFERLVYRKISFRNERMWKFRVWKLMYLKLFMCRVFLGVCVFILGLRLMFEYCFILLFF